MPTIVQFRRGTTAQNNAFTGSAGEISIDTDLEVIRVHDGVTAGGYALAGLTAAQSLTNKSYAGNTVSATGNITGGNITTAGIITVNSGAAATAIVNGAANAVGNIGSSSVYFNRLFAQATTALYADLAEMYASDAEYPAGTVLIFDGTAEVSISTQAHDTKVAGVVSTNPAHIMNSGIDAECSVAVALSGRVPCQVIGPITKGDRLVSSDIPGVAQRLDMAQYQPGVIIGKAIENYSGSKVGTIEVVVGRL